MYHEVVSILQLLVGKMQLYHGLACLAAPRAGGLVHTPHHRWERTLEEGQGMGCETGGVLGTEVREEGGGGGGGGEGMKSD